jgi:transmembrane sensor
MDQGELSPEQTAELQQWIAKSDFHRNYLHQLAHNWDSMGILQELAELFPIQPTAATPATQPVMPATQPVMPAQAGTSGTHTQPEPVMPANPIVMPAKAGISNPQPPTPTTWLQNLIAQLKQPKAWAPTLATFALVAILINTQQLNHFETDIGQQTSDQLSDGTHITLNTNSELKVDYSQDRRRIYLLRGEAHFNVAKNPQRPFMVYAGEGMVWAVGTAFNVRYLNAGNLDGNHASNHIPSSIDVTVTEGTVKIFADIEPDKNTSLNINNAQNSPTDHEQLVHAGKSVQYSKVINATQTTPAQVLEQKLAWQHGALIFKGETLEQAIKEIARYTDKQLIITDPSIKNIRVGGHYKTDNIDSLLASLSETLEIKLEQKGSQLHLSAID